MALYDLLSLVKQPPGPESGLALFTYELVQVTLQAQDYLEVQIQFFRRFLAPFFSI